MQEFPIKRENSLGSERLGALKDTGGKKEKEHFFHFHIPGCESREIFFKNCIKSKEKPVRWACWFSISVTEKCVYVCGQRPGHFQKPWPLLLIFLFEIRAFPGNLFLAVYIVQNYRCLFMSCKVLQLQERAFWWGGASCKPMPQQQYLVSTHNSITLKTRWIILIAQRWLGRWPHSH